MYLIQNASQSSKLPLTHHEIKNAQDFRDGFFNELLEHTLEKYGPDRGYPRLTLDLDNYAAVRYGGQMLQFHGESSE